MIGQTVSHYRVLERIGVGGMGGVYKAEDLRLKRMVALKFLTHERQLETTSRIRFTQEAQSASALDHPNVCTIYEIDETKDGQLFIAMAYYEGETLRKRLFPGPMAMEEAIETTIQVCQGLEQAHRRGIVHRDIKPANLMITLEGVVKILDFGIAVLSGSSRITGSGRLLGSTAYVSPEVIRGLTVDRRTDIWSLGVVIFEMLTGHIPFKGISDQAIIHSILTAEAPRLTELESPLVKGLQNIVERALAKEPDHRYQEIQDLRHELEGLGGTGVSSVLPRLSRSEDLPSIAVLPFVDMSREQDQEYFCDGLAEELISALTRVENLRVAARTSAFQFKGRSLDIREIGRRLNVRTVLEGSVRKAGNRLRVTAELVNVDDGYHLWSERYDREMEDLFAMQDEIAHMIVERLSVKLVTGTGDKLVKPYSGDLEAYSLYLKGRYYWNRRTEEDLKKGIDFFEQAIAIDKDYAPALAGLSDSYTLLGIYGMMPPRDVMPRAKAAAQRALELDPTLAAVHTSLGCVKAVFDWSWLDAERHFRRAIELDPKYATGHHWYAINYLTPLRRFDGAVEAMERALQLDPMSPAISSSYGVQLYYARRYQEAIAHYLKTIEIDPNFAQVHFFLGQVYTEASRYERAIEEFHSAIELSGGSAEMAAALAYCCARSGREKKARELLGELVLRAKKRFVSPVLFAQVHLGLGDEEEALRCLDRGFEMRACDLVWLEVRPVFDCLHSHPRFAQMLSKMGLGQFGLFSDTASNPHPLPDGDPSQT